MKEVNDRLPFPNTIETSEMCKFQILPSSGILPPSKSTTFVAHFNPEHVSKCACDSAIVEKMKMWRRDVRL